MSGPQEWFLTRTLYIPVEIFNRELGGALLLGAEAAARGWRVVLGAKQAVFNNMSRFRRAPGVFFLKSVVPGEVFKQREIMADGHRVVSLDVEGLVPSNGVSGVRLRYSEESTRLTDLLFFWGGDHYNAVHAVYPEIESKSVVSGSPIIDEILIRGKRRDTARRNGSRKRILIGTSCGYANHMNGIGFAREMTRNAYGQNVDGTASRALEYEAILDQKIFEYWKEIVPRIGESFKDCDIVLRPHPSENKEFWRSYLKRHENIGIDENQSILEEMLRSDIYVHFNSTSALTSTMLGIPTFMPLPQMKGELSERITYVKDVSITAQTIDELIARIREYIIEPKKKFLQADISRYCQNLKENGYSASRCMVDALERKYVFASVPGALQRQDARERSIVYFRKTKYFFLWIAGILLRGVGVEPGRAFPPRNAYKNANAKQPATRLEEVERMMSEILDTKLLGLVMLEQEAKNLFVMNRRRI